MSSPAPVKQTHGFLFAFAAYTTWGLLPLYWKCLYTVSPIQILCHRVLWSSVLLAGVLSFRHDWGWLRAFVRQPKKLMLYACSTSMLTLNWLVYIWAVNTGHILDSSLGSFMTPLLSVLLGRVVLGERLSAQQKVAVALALLGVGWITVASGVFPLVALCLAASFALYGLLRKKAPLPVLEGLMLESFLTLPLALAALGWFEWHGCGSFGHAGSATNLLLFSTGVVTVVPLFLFAHGAQRLRLATLGLIQYISPTLQLLLGVMLYHETFNSTRIIGFVCIWAGLLFYALSSMRSLFTGLSQRTVTGKL